MVKFGRGQKFSSATNEFRCVLKSLGFTPLSSLIVIHGEWVANNLEVQSCGVKCEKRQQQPEYVVAAGDPFHVIE